MAYSRLKFKHQYYKIKYDPSDNKNYDAIAYDHNGNWFGIKISYLKKILDILEKKGSCTIIGGGIEEKVPVEEFFEIAGVEEAAHLMFFQEKGCLGDGIIASAPEDLDYYTSDMEWRALIWKLWYVKKYFPQYYNSLRETYKNVSKIRRTEN